MGIFELFFVIVLIVCGLPAVDVGVYVNVMGAADAVHDSVATEVAPPAGPEIEIVTVSVRTPLGVTVKLVDGKLITPPAGPVIVKLLAVGAPPGGAGPPGAVATIVFSIVWVAVWPA